MESLGISPNVIQQYASIMGETLAIMHWVGEIDGNDIEFVLAPPNEEDDASSQIQSYTFGDHSEWSKQLQPFGAMILTTLDQEKTLWSGLRFKDTILKPVMLVLRFASRKKQTDDAFCHGASLI
ncbi:Protein of unknown function DUF3669 zinc finger protein [Penicillium canariense]|uniref:DUF3669 domain-containing protein n=1 Tax=Penicillium canariense TaxID=189055 RepID=A0A9W9IHU7_9EURO|nr:Protein of unknown function DUF3669 zinc finger protein [Penicillium canariense]KAJ5176579.1 Protein of unknown function DUF3669 zinc finger protein [Penicillium canariense]